MTIVEWLRGRAPSAPPELLARIEQVLGARGSRDVAAAPDACLEAASELLRALVANPEAGRESALDLLCADALVTYAFEAAADRGDWVARNAPTAIARFAAAAAVGS